MKSASTASQRLSSRNHERQACNWPEPTEIGGSDTSLVYICMDFSRRFECYCILFNGFSPNGDVSNLSDFLLRDLKRIVMEPT